MFVLLNHILYVFDIKKDLLDIQEKDLLPINGDTSKTYKGYYGTTEHWNIWSKKGKQFTGFGSLEFEYPDSISKTLSNIPILIQKIRAFNPNFYIDEEFAEILSSIETSKVIELYANKKNALFLFADSSQYLYKLISDYKRLLKKGYSKVHRNSFHKIHIYTPEENAIVPINRKKLLSIGSPRLKKIMSLFPCIIYNNQSDTAKSIVAEMNSGFIIDMEGKNRSKTYVPLSTQNEISINDNCKCIIIIDRKLSKRIINNLINSNAGKIIILITSNICHTTKCGRFKNKIITKGTYKVYCRTAFSFLGLKYNTKYPTPQMIRTISSNIEDIMENSTEE